MEDLYRIGELARLSGLSVKTIRFYSDRGLVPPAGRTGPGYRLYDEHALARLELVRALRELGASLDDVERVLERALDLPAWSPCSSRRWRRSSGCCGCGGRSCGPSPRANTTLRS